MIAIVDTGPLYAAIDRSDADHARCAQVLGRTDLDFVVPALVVAEVALLAESRLGPSVEAEFIRGLAHAEVEAPVPEDWPRMADLVSKYADFPLGSTHASVSVLADRLGTDLIVTLDQRHFRALRTRNGGTYTLLPG